MAKRVDIVPISGGWLVTDSGAIQHLRPNYAAAVEEALRIGRQFAFEGVSVHAWTNGEAHLVATFSEDGSRIWQG